jgi:triosephosphate isomerase (TIM)
VSGPRPLIAGNWKMNGRRRTGLAEARAIVRGLSRRKRLRPEVLLCPPAVLIPVLCPVLQDGPVALGAQDCHAGADGAHTGDLSAGMLADAGCAYVIVGHSERRAEYGENDRLVRAKAEAAQAAGLTAIVCVGETAAERRRGRTLDVVGHQLAGSLPKGATAASTVVAYEPVWAIGSGQTPTPDDVAEVHAMLRARLARRFGVEGRAMRLLYGGSVNPGNAEALLAVPEVNGALVGGASLTAASFLPIVRAVA